VVQFFYWDWCAALEIIKQRVSVNHAASAMSGLYVINSSEVLKIPPALRKAFTAQCPADTLTH
jgi:hypothetical protein